MKTVLFRPEAIHDINNAFSWYEGRNPGLGEEFVRSVEVGIDRIKRTPLLASKVHGNIRRVLIRRFPYGIFYFVEGANLFVLGCLHAKRNPTSWKGRVP
ncbi:MAG: type II toxin-antitoxin system RelE/ParE family toxin [Elusimicrobia bacterium]|nr:type II toxin-antitoxin system RelE/ParE family toxin [Elusimicrobiota bacterium]